MKKVFFTGLALALAVLVNAQPPAGKAKPGTVYGAKVDGQNATEARSLPAMLNDKDTITVKVKAKVLDACASKGCWMSLKLNDSTEAFVKMKDYAFFVPRILSAKRW